MLLLRVACAMHTVGTTRVWFSEPECGYFSVTASLRRSLRITVRVAFATAFVSTRPLPLPPTPPSPSPPNQTI
eukprot:gene9079-biopygen2137